MRATQDLPVHGQVAPDLRPRCGALDEPARDARAARGRGRTRATAPTRCGSSSSTPLDDATAGHRSARVAATGSPAPHQRHHAGVQPAPGASCGRPSTRSGLSSTRTGSCALPTTAHRSPTSADILAEMRPRTLASRWCDARERAHLGRLQLGVVAGHRRVGRLPRPRRRPGRARPRLGGARAWPSILRPGIVYSDEDKLDDAGHRREPFFKPDFDPLLLIGAELREPPVRVPTATSSPRSGGTGKGTREARTGTSSCGCRSCSSPSRCVHIPHVLYHWRVTAARRRPRCRPSRMRSTPDGGP